MRYPSPARREVMLCLSSVEVGGPGWELGSRNPELVSSDITC